MEIKNIHTVYLVGIGGIGMSALAKYFLNLGKTVGGYDKTPTEITQNLQQQGAVICFKDSVDEIVNPFKNKKETLVIYTPAIPKHNKQLAYFRKNNFNVLKRSEILGKISENSFCIAVAGTHGKTTVTAILGHIFKELNLKATTFLGGISENYQSNLILGGDEIYVVEADEFDRSFLQLSPNLACITSVEADHLDVYENKEEIQQAFEEFANNVSESLIVHKDTSMLGITYGLENENVDYEAKNIKVKDGNYIFDVRTPKGTIESVQISLAGRHNISNTLAAFALASSYGISINKIAKALLSFKGIKRRFTYHIKSENKVLIEDYAHHPSAITEIARTVKEMHPNKKNVVVFQPHLYSRTLHFAKGFAKALKKFDEVILLDIYPAREKKIEGVTSEWLLEKIKKKKKQLSSKKKLFKRIKKTKAEVVIMLGAGDIGDLVEDIKAKWNEN